MYRRDVVERKAAVLRAAQIIVQRQSNILTDEEAATSPEAFEVWAANMKYGEGQVIMHKDTLYRIAQAGGVAKSLASQPPDGVGMLAVYRPLGNGTGAFAEGTLENPIPYVSGMDCVTGKYYSYNNKVYLCKADMLPCVWPPDTAGLWQWELQK